LASLPLIALAVLISITSYITTKITIRILLRCDLVGIDVHKPWKPKVAEPGGIALLITCLVSILLVLLLKPLEVDYTKFIAIIISTIYAGLIGLLDDIKVLDAKTKTLLTFTTAMPIILLGAYTPRPIMPFAGTLRITIIYPLLIPFAYMIALNAVNMSDTHNGVMPSTALIIGGVLLFSTISTYIKGYTDLTGFVLSLILVSMLLGYVWFNWYPAKVFNGDSGSFLVAALIVGSAIVGRAEVPVIIAMMVYIVNGFQILASIKGLVERRSIIRPVVVENGWIKANKDPRAPITIPHLLSLRDKVNEKEIIAGYLILSIISGILGIITAILCYWL